MAENDEVVALTVRFPAPLYERLRLRVFNQKRTERSASLNSLIVRFAEEGLRALDAVDASKGEE